MKILEVLKEHYGENRVLNIATFSREGSRSALLSACRGMGIDVDEASYLTNLIPTERGKTLTLSDSYFGNESRKPVKELVDAVKQYDGLMEISLKIENVIKNNSVHASGIYIFNDDFVKQNAMMKSSTGLETTQFSMSDSDAMGSLKLDCLTVSNLDKVRQTMDMLLDDGVFEWQGSLRETYNKYLHPNVLTYDDEEMWNMVSENSIPDLFQFDTNVGLETAQKTKPTNILELSAANMLMRLMSDGDIQPVDKYVLNKQNYDNWMNEMKEYGLTQDEIDIMEEHLSKVSGVSSSQEEIMELSMDERIANFTIVEANNLRKAVAKIDPIVLQEVKNKFFEKGKNRASDRLLHYVWDKQIMLQAGYGFSMLHSSSYSLIALQNMNLARFYPSVYWNTACLTVNSGSTDENSTRTKTSEYGKVAIAISDMQQKGIDVMPPDINKAGYSFKPNAKDNEILFGLNGIINVGSDVVQTIIHNRPYKSFEDFYDKLVKPKIVTNSQVLQLIKAGCFNSLSDPLETMRTYLKLTFKPKKQLTIASLKSIIEMNIVPKELSTHIRYYNFRQHIQKNMVGKSDKRKTKNKLFLLDDVSTEFLLEHFSEECIVDYQEGQPIVAEYIFDKEYDKKMKVVKEWLSQSETLELYNKLLFEEEWNKSADGTIAEWEMGSLSYYYTKHELEHLNKEKYSIENFNDLTEEPVSVKEFEWKGRKGHEFKTSRIAGTVLDKDKNRHTVALLTTDGVVNVKFYGGQYSKYDKQISKRNSNGKKTVVESSWFKRGSKLLITGYRRGNQFIPKTYRNSVYNKPIVLIKSIDDNGDIQTISERAEV